MRMINSFEELYSTLIRRYKVELENLRKKAKKEKRSKFCFMLVIMLLSVVAVFAIKYYKQSAIIDSIKYALSFGLLIGMLMFLFFTAIKKIIFRKKLSAIQLYEKKYKEMIGQTIIDGFIDENNWVEKGLLENEVYNEALFENQYDVIRTKDLIEGTVLENDLVMANIEVSNKSINGDGDVTYKPIFKGIWIRINLSDEFEKVIAVRNKKTNQDYLNGMFRVLTDSEEWNQKFDVFTTYTNTKIIDKVLSELQVQKLLILQKRTKMQFEFTLKEKYLYVRINTPIYFESPSLRKEVLEKEIIYSYYKQFESIYEILSCLISSIETEQNDE